jgi:FkbM family methyltransferase
LLNTHQKIFLARCAYQVVHCARRMFGREDRLTVARHGITWALDLSEGIDFAIYLLGAFEQSSIDAYSHSVRLGHVVLDVGANIGAHTLPLARLVGPEGRVIAFEPTVNALTKLAHNVGLNPDLAKRIHLEQLMLTDTRNTEPAPRLYSSWPLKNATGARHATHEGVLAETTGADASTLDDYLRRNDLARVDFMKIDVDGSECRVLRGARETLASFRPDILIEFMPHGLDEAGESLAHLVEILKTAGYCFFRVPSLTPLPDDVEILRRLIPAGGGINVLCRALAASK